MGIAIIDQQQVKQFHLYNKKISYIIGVYGDGTLAHLYSGGALRTDKPYLQLAFPFSGYGGFPNADKIPARFEYPMRGSGDFRLPAFEADAENGAPVSGLVYTGHSIYKGKHAVPGLPSTYTENDDEADSLEIDCADTVSGITVTLFYTVYRDQAVIVRHAKIAYTNAAKAPCVLRGAMSFCLDLPDSQWNMITLTGAWGRENHVTDMPLRPGFQGVESARGIPGHQQNPLLILRRSGTTEFSGEALGLSLAYSGNFMAAAEVDSYGMTRLRIGINPETFVWNLAPGGVFETPEAVFSWSDDGLNGLSQNFHEFFRSRLAAGFWRDRERPVLLNNWEGTYFNFTEDKLVDMAKVAKDLGVELFVLDDGWFGRRDNDTTSLGDWFVDTRKLPGGLAGLAKKINALGLKFGLWIEPEMISEKSELYKAHPDWAVGIPHRPHTEQRSQMVLDMGRPEIVDYLFRVLSDVLSSAPIAYIKWDMNRSITEPFSPGCGGGEFFHRYALGLYDLYGRLTKAFPEILFESCCSGGGRFDPGILAFAPQAWTSDDTDAVERLSIQAGASLAYPLSSMGAHVSDVPNHQTARLTPINFRAMVSFFGVLGYELDPTKLNAADRAAVRKQIAFYKEHRRLFQYGRFTRLINARDTGGDHAAWMVSGGDRGEAIVGFYALVSRPNRLPVTLKLRDLDPSADYDVTLWEDGAFQDSSAPPNGLAGIRFIKALPRRAVSGVKRLIRTGQLYSEDHGRSISGFFGMDRKLSCGRRGGDELMKAGLMLRCVISPPAGDFRSEIFVLKKV